MKVSYAELIAQHQALVEGANGEATPEVLDRVKTYIANVAAAGADIPDPRQREQLRSILRIWSSYVYDHTKEYPRSQLAPASGVIPLRPRVDVRWVWLGGLVLAGVASLVIGGRLLRAPLISNPTPTHTPEIAPCGPPLNWELHTVQPDETLSRIAITTGTTVQQLQRANCLASDLIQAGQLLYVPFPPPTKTPTPSATSSPTGSPTSTSTATQVPSATPSPTRGPSPTATATRPPRTLVSLILGRGIVYDVAFSPDGRWLAAGGGNGIITFWDISNISEPQEVQTLESGDTILNVDFSPDGAYFAAALFDGTVHVWPVISLIQSEQPPPTPIATQPATEQPAVVLKELEVVLPAHEGSVPGLAFSPDGTVLASVGIDGRVILWSVGPWSEFTSPPVAANPLLSVAFSPDGRLLAFGGTGPNLLMWDFFREEVAATLQATSRTTVSLAFSPDGLFLAVGSNDGSVRLWERASAESTEFTAVQEPVHKSGAGYDVTFSPTGILATAKDDGTIDLWEVQFGTVTRLATLAGQHVGVVRSLSFSSDGKWMVSGGSDQRVVIWAVR